MFLQATDGKGGAESEYVLMSGKRPLGDSARASKRAKTRCSGKTKGGRRCRQGTTQYSAYHFNESTGQMVVERESTAMCGQHTRMQEEREEREKLEEYKQHVQNPNGLPKPFVPTKKSSKNLDFLTRAAQAVYDADQKWWPCVKQWLRTLPRHPAHLEHKIVQHQRSLGFFDGCSHTYHAPLYRIYADLSPEGVAKMPSEVRETLLAQFECKEIQVDFEYQKGLGSDHFPPLDVAKLMLGYLVALDGFSVKTPFTEDDCDMGEEITDVDTPTLPTAEELSSGDIIFKGKVVVHGTDIDSGDCFFVENSLRPATAESLGSRPEMLTERGVNNTTLCAARDVMRTQAFAKFAKGTTITVACGKEEDGEKKSENVAAVIGAQFDDNTKKVTVTLLLPDGREITVPAGQCVVVPI